MQFVKNLIDDLADSKKKEMEKRACKIAQKVKKAVGRKHIGLRTKMQFLMFQGMQTGEASAWNPTDKNWWMKQGWLGKKRPWK